MKEGYSQGAIDRRVDVQAAWAAHRFKLGIATAQAMAGALKTSDAQVQGSRTRAAFGAVLASLQRCRGGLRRSRSEYDGAAAYAATQACRAMLMADLALALEHSNVSCLAFDPSAVAPSAEQGEAKFSLRSSTTHGPGLALDQPARLLGGGEGRGSTQVAPHPPASEHESRHPKHVQPPSSSRRISAVAVDGGTREELAQAKVKEDPEVVEASTPARSSADPHAGPGRPMPISTVSRWFQAKPPSPRAVAGQPELTGPIPELGVWMRMAVGKAVSQEWSGCFYCATNDTWVALAPTSTPTPGAIKGLLDPRTAFMARSLMEEAMEAVGLDIRVEAFASGMLTESMAEDETRSQGSRSAKGFREGPRGKFSSRRNSLTRPPPPGPAASSSSHRARAPRKSLFGGWGTQAVGKAD